MRLDGAVREKKKKNAVTSSRKARPSQYGASVIPRVLELRGTPPSGGGFIRAQMIAIELCDVLYEFLHDHVRPWLFASSGVLRAVPRSRNKLAEKMASFVIPSSPMYMGPFMCEPPKEPGASFCFALLTASTVPKTPS